MMSIHIVFSDGSNPYVRYGMDPEQFALELLKWTKRFCLEFDGVIGGSILQFVATEK